MTISGSSTQSHLIEPSNTKLSTPSIIGLAVGSIFAGLIITIGIYKAVQLKKSEE
jgi:uncharacterized protein (DUF2062 family)